MNAVARTAPLLVATLALTGSFLLERDREITLQCRSAGVSGAGPAEAMVTMQAIHVELTLR